MINCAKMLLNFKLSKFVWFVYGDEDDDGHYFLEGKVKKKNSEAKLLKKYFYEQNS